MEGTTLRNDGGKERDLCLVTIHFEGGKSPVRLLAEEFDIDLGEEGLERGLRKYAYTAVGGDRVPLYLDPGEVRAILVVPVGRDETHAAVPPRGSDRGTVSDPAGRGRRGTSEPESTKQEEMGEEARRTAQDGTGRSPGRWSPSGVPAAGARRGTPRSSELEREVLKLLCRFVVAEAGQLRRAREAERRLLERGLYSLAAERFFYSDEQASEQIRKMDLEDLVETCKNYNFDRSEPVYQATQKGAELVGMGSLPSVSPTENAHGTFYYTKMLDLSQRIVGSLGGEAEWVTGRELLSEEIRTAREEDVGRSLPSAVPGAHGAWPMTPEGVLVMEDRATVAAVGLELTRVSDRRLAAYEAILERYSVDPAIDRAYLFFAHEDALQRVEELSRRYRQDEFLVFREYQAEGPVELSG